jgi:hypothetical protein
MAVGLVQAGETDWVLIPTSECITRSGLMTGRSQKHLAVRHRNVGFGFWSVVTALATFALFGGQLMKTVSNEITSADGGWRVLFAFVAQWAAAAEFFR